MQGKWIFNNDKVIGDETCQYIEYLINNYLEKRATDKAGWEVLYIDPEDNRYWELTYMQGELHGGGPPTLKVVSQEYIQNKYLL